ncbi:MAG: alpha-amylase family glycosyl hydrolase [Desulfobacterales bacterium]
MMKKICYPSLYQVNTRVWLTLLSQTLGRSAQLDDLPDAELDRLAGMGFDWIWFLSVWQTGPAAQAVSRANPEWRREFEETLTDLKDGDIAGSGFAIQNYTVHRDLGGDAALARLRQRLQMRGLKLMLDFVPNHMAPDHPWVEDHPEYFVTGTEDLLTREPQNYIRVKRKKGDSILAYGRDPYFPGWPDTLQLDYSHPATQEAMIHELEKIADQCDGVRCDMAMLVLPDVFERTWGRRPELFWPRATETVREQYPDFCFMAEVYWDLEWTLQQQGFDYTYDKRLYDRLREGQARPVREHLHAALEYQAKLARFLENHDEPRASAAFEPHVHRVAAVITYVTPGLRFFHQGQFDGRRKSISPHLVRAPEESPDKAIEAFYDHLLAILRKPVAKSGEWQWLACQPAWDGNGSWDAFVAHTWQGSAGERMLVAVNFAPHPSQCYITLPFPEITNRSVRLKDLFSSASYIREGNELLERGLYLDLPPWSYHVFDVEIKQ